MKILTRSKPYHGHILDVFAFFLFQKNKKDKVHTFQVSGMILVQYITDMGTCTKIEYPCILDLMLYNTQLN